MGEIAVRLSAASIHMLDLSDAHASERNGALNTSVNIRMGIAFTFFAGILAAVGADHGEPLTPLQPDLLPNGYRYSRETAHPVAQLPDGSSARSAYKISASSAADSVHIIRHIQGPGKQRHIFIAYSYFMAACAATHRRSLSGREEVAYFVPPQGGDLKHFGSYDRNR